MKKIIFMIMMAMSTMVISDWVVVIVDEDDVKITNDGIEIIDDGIEIIDAKDADTESNDFHKLQKRFEKMENELASLKAEINKDNIKISKDLYDSPFSFTKNTCDDFIINANAHILLRQSNNEWLDVEEEMSWIDDNGEFQTMDGNELMSMVQRCSDLLRELRIKRYFKD